MAIRFRRAQSEDLAELLTMMKELQKDDPWSVPFDDAAAAKACGHILRDPSLGCIWIICHRNESVGYVVMTFDYSLEYRGRGAWVDELYVRRAHREKGIGTQALNFCAQRAAEQNVSVIHLEVNKSNPAVELYGRMGFEDHHRYLMTKWISEKPTVFV
jgi:diamine N-acetyltransferase